MKSGLLTHSKYLPFSSSTQLIHVFFSSSLGAYMCVRMYVCVYLLGLCYLRWWCIFVSAGFSNFIGVFVCVCVFVCGYPFNCIFSCHVLDSQYIYRRQYHHYMDIFYELYNDPTDEVHRISIVGKKIHFNITTKYHGALYSLLVSRDKKKTEAKQKKIKWEAQEICNYVNCCICELCGKVLLPKGMYKYDFTYVQR